jgi:predicted transcriptional regulator
MRGLKILQHLSPKTLRSLTHSLDLDVKSVRDNVTAMIAWGLEERNEDGMVHVPYNVIHAEFDLKAVA